MWEGEWLWYDRIPAVAGKRSRFFLRESRAISGRDRLMDVPQWMKLDAGHHRVRAPSPGMPALTPTLQFASLLQQPCQISRYPARNVKIRFISH